MFHALALLGIVFTALLGIVFTAHAQNELDGGAPQEFVHI